jgi:ATP-dependent DNA helicase UvrD/PcrA
MHPRVADRLARLSPDQYRAATAPPGPVLCVAPAGSGKTTTLVGRVAWRIDAGDPPASMCALTFNRRAADELRTRLEEALAPLAGVAGSPPRVRVRTFHALGREILRDAGRPVEPLLDRLEVIADLAGEALPSPVLRRLDDGFSRLKLDAMVDRARAQATLSASVSGAGASVDPGHRATLEAFVAYESELARRGGLDFDDLVARALHALDAEPALLERWRLRCRILFVDETQDLDRSQLELAMRLAAPENDCFLVGDDDQTISATLHA